MQWRVLGVVVLAALAGCGAVGGSGGEETVTPAPVPTTAPDALATNSNAEPVLAPGVTPAGIVDLDLLIDNHRSILLNVSYVMTDDHREVYVRSADLRLPPRTRRVVYEGDGTFWRYESAVDPDAPSRLRYVRDLEQYGTDGRTYSKWEVLGVENTTYELLDDHTPSTNLGVPVSNFKRYLELENQSVSRADVGERPHFVVSGTQSEVDRYGSIENFSARMVVRDDGLIRQLDVSFLTDDDDDNRVRVAYELRYSQFGNATVTPPDWLDEARDRVGST